MNGFIQKLQAWLGLGAAKARALGWRPVFDIRTGLAQTFAALKAAT